MMVQQCTEYDIDGGLCQLKADHVGLHAANVGDAFLTWQFGEVLRWSTDAPFWLYELAWMPELQPMPRDDVA